MKKNPMKTNPVTRLTVRRAQRRGDSAMMAIGDVLHQWQGESRAAVGVLEGEIAARVPTTPPWPGGAW